jgi:hypothetical protein
MMLDHDQRFKVMLQTFFQHLLELFWARYAACLDAAAAEWLDKEVFPDPPTGQRRALDLVAKVPVHKPLPGEPEGEAPDTRLALVHLEVEAPDKTTLLVPRLPQAYFHLRGKYGLKVLPLVVYLNVGLDGLGVGLYEEHFGDLCVLTFRYLYAGLPALDGVQYVQGDNCLGWALAALMRVPPERAAWLAAEALRRIQEAPLTDQQRYLLGECVQAYLPLDEEQQQQFERLVATEPYRGVQVMKQTIASTWYEKGLEQGLEKGQRTLLRGLLEARFGPLSAAVLERLQQLPADHLEPLGKALLQAQSLKELRLED